MSEATDRKSGFAVLVGRTNVGKSTLLNALVGTKIAIVTPKPQTTRDTYHGVVTRPEGQIVFVDTPGIFETEPTKLVANLHHKVRDALEGIDVVVHVVDPSRAIGTEDRHVIELVRHVTQPRILVLNKADLPERPWRQDWLDRAGEYAHALEVSALTGKGVEELVRAIMGLLPTGPLHYPEGQVTNVSNEFWIREVIREKIYLQTGQEVPYTATVQVEKIEDRQTKDGKPLLYIKAAILTTDDRHQRMLIGAGGRRVREIGAAARHELEVALNRKVFLDLTVLVDPHWMDRLETA
ncbi:MAG: GTPase Era [Verrucomicrobiae bacterium]|nr:GTPase Era [Verrucomicrobiae bacterium]MDW8343571.1 GTPase Era [Verrucomicrobiae bacterium]